MKKYIPVTKEEREKLAKIFKCSERMFRPLRRAWARIRESGSDPMW